MVENAIKQYLMENMLFSDTFDYPDEASFLQTGILDSTGVLELVLFVEQTYGFKVLQTDVTPHNFDSVANLATYIRSHVVTPA